MAWKTPGNIASPQKKDGKISVANKLSNNLYKELKLGSKVD